MGIPSKLADAASLAMNSIVEESIVLVGLANADSECQAHLSPRSPRMRDSLRKNKACPACGFQQDIPGIPHTDIARSNLHNHFGKNSGEIRNDHSGPTIKNGK